MRISDWSSDVCSSDLNISVPGGREINRDALSSGERTGQSPNRAPCGHGVVGPTDAWESASGSPLERGARDGESPVGDSRSEERRVGKEGVSTCRSRWSTDHYKKQQVIKQKNI